MFVEHKEAGEQQEVKLLDDANKLLLDGSDVLAIDGWCQGSYENGLRKCILGAIGFRYGEPAGPVMMIAYMRLEKAVNGAPHLWNDGLERTAEEVISTMRRVALGG